MTTVVKNLDEWLTQLEDSIQTYGFENVYPYYNLKNMYVGFLVEHPCMTPRGPEVTVLYYEMRLLAFRSQIRQHSSLPDWIDWDVQEPRPEVALTYRLLDRKNKCTHEKRTLPLPATETRQAGSAPSARRCTRVGLTTRNKLADQRKPIKKMKQMETEDNAISLRSYLLKVYSILTGALVVTLATTYGSVTYGALEPVKMTGKTVMAPMLVAMVANHPIGMILAYFSTFFLLLFLMKNLNLGLVGLGLFSVASGLLLGPTVFLVSTHVGSTLSAHPIRDAVALTLLSFGGLSSYVIVKGEDFRPWGGFLLTALIVAILVMLGAAIFGSTLPLLFNGLIVLLFFGYVLYDTSEIIHGNRSDPVGDAVALYLDMFNLFIHLLAILKSDD